MCEWQNRVRGVSISCDVQWIGQVPLDQFIFQQDEYVELD